MQRLDLILSCAQANKSLLLVTQPHIQTSTDPELRATAVRELVLAQQTNLQFCG